MSSDEVRREFVHIWHDHPELSAACQVLADALPLRYPTRAAGLYDRFVALIEDFAEFVVQEDVQL